MNQFKSILSLTFFSLMCLTSLSQKSSSDFVFTIKTDHAGISNDSSFIFYADTNYFFDFDIDWNNDGVFDQFNVQNSISHHYNAPGTYNIRLRGTFPSLKFGLQDSSKLTDVVQWGTQVWQSLDHAFNGCRELVAMPLDTPNLSSLTDLSHMFQNCVKFIGNISHWDVSGITDMSYMFAYKDNLPIRTAFNENINQWNVSNVVSMKHMFFESKNFNQPL